jgi:hypothetical protein
VEPQNQGAMHLPCTLLAIALVHQVAPLGSIRAVAQANPSTLTYRQCSCRSYHPPARPPRLHSYPSILTYREHPCSSCHPSSICSFCPERQDRITQKLDHLSWTRKKSSKLSHPSPPLGCPKGIHRPPGHPLCWALFRPVIKPNAHCWD